MSRNQRQPLYRGASERILSLTYSQLIRLLMLVVYAISGTMSTLYFMVRVRGLEPPRLATLEPTQTTNTLIGCVGSTLLESILRLTPYKSRVSTNSTTLG